MSFRILQGDVLARLCELPDESVHCVVTSPPYWGLRDYGVEGQIGQEPTPEEYVLKLVEVFRETRRVLRSVGTFWVNMGDSYCSTAPGTTGDPLNQRGILAGVSNHRAEASRRFRFKTPHGLKPKDLVGMPWRLATALQADGWWLRSDVIWAKPNPMPESVTDRPTKSHEYLFLLTRSSSYYYDAEAISEIAVGDTPGNLTHKGKTAYENGDVHMRTKAGLAKVSAISRRNKRSVWTIAVEAFSDAHFATFPTKLVEPCILAGTSEHGCCASCGAPWKRITERTHTFQSGSGRAGHAPSGKFAGSVQAESGDYDIRLGPVITTATIGWEPSCLCNAGVSPSTVLDPFNGAGTAGLVALRLGRSYIGIELNPEYVAMSKRRIDEDAPLFRQKEQP
jgi:DNA modification methylase